MTRPEPSPRPELAGLTIADLPGRWQELGFAVDAGDRVVLGGVELALGGAGPGITSWTLRHVTAGDEIDGLPTSVVAQPPGASPEHPNGAVGVDHVVIVTPDFDRTASALAARGLGLRRVRESGERRQGFRRLGPTIMELVESPEVPVARFWGLTVAVADLDALASAYPHVGEVRPAVQPGRHIATLDRAAGLSARVAFMDPEVRR